MEIRQPAPRLGLLAALLTATPCILAQWPQLSSGIIVFLGVGIAVVLGAGVMVVFETIGAVQYDKEHQSRKIWRRHRALMEAHNHIEEDLDRAEKIQRNLIPAGDKQPHPEALRLIHRFQPQMQVGGDCYDYKKVGDNKIAIIFADVSGHGMAGAFVTAIIKTTFEMGNETLLSPQDFMTNLNALLSHLTPDDSFAAVIYGVYDIDSQRISYVNAGHQPVPIIMRRDDLKVSNVNQKTGPVTGFLEAATYEQHDIDFKPGDRLILCTDGIAETFNEQHEQFGDKRLLRLLNDTCHQPVEQTPDIVLQSVEEHCGEAEQADDRAVLILEVKEKD